MLQRLFIQNLVTIEKQEINLAPGFSVLTGETGAGKSVMIKAIGLILGGKSSRGVIRYGEKYLLVEALFDISNLPAVKHFLEQLGIEAEDELVIRRRVSISGKNNIYINDLVTSLTNLNHLGKLLVDLQGQHAQQSLLSQETHLEYLDQFANLSDARKDYRISYQEMQEKIRLKEQLDRELDEREKKMDFLRFQIDEIENADLSIEEEQGLLEEYNQLNHREQLTQLVGHTASWNEIEDSPLTPLNVSLRDLETAAGIDSRLAANLENFQSAVIMLQEGVGDLSQYLSNLENDPARLDQINQRLSELDKLKRKYGSTVEEILQYYDQIEQELLALENIEASHEKIEQEIEELKKLISIKAIKISEIRKEKSVQLTRQIEIELKELGFEKSKFKIDIKTAETDLLSNFGPNGIDQIEFMISTNPGTPVSSLIKIASGGELSRIMLALKTVLIEENSPATIIFDEIDTGISGAIAEIVGEKIKKLGQKQQIISITHLPQIASKASSHLKVEKHIRNDITTTKITSLTEEDKIKELARFLGGAEITERTLSAAREMLNS